jgi:hypothetical protein
VRIFAYFKNLPLMAAFLGFGIGLSQYQRGEQLFRWFHRLITYVVIIIAGGVSSELLMWSLWTHANTFCSAEALMLVHWQTSNIGWTSGTRLPQTSVCKENSSLAAAFGEEGPTVIEL